jgi:hypothetical protein
MTTRMSHTRVSSRQARRLLALLKAVRSYDLRLVASMLALSDKLPRPAAWGDLPSPRAGAAGGGGTWRRPD